MSLSRKDVLHVAALARLHVTETEQDALAQELNRILAYAGQLKKPELDVLINLAEVEATNNRSETGMVTRPDEPGESLPPEVVLANAPDTEGRQFRVPAVLEVE